MIKKIIDTHTALLIVDMQNYYLNKKSSYYRYFNNLQPGCLEYLLKRCNDIVIPNIQKITRMCKKQHAKVVYLKLCGKKEDRSDLHRFFRETNKRAALNGFEDVYPLNKNWMSDIIDPLKPQVDDIVIEKTTYSPFTLTKIHSLLQDNNISKIIMTGLATSQCVETTARDASDHDYEIIQVEDAQSDYDELTHVYSLFSSKGVCGSTILSTDELLSMLQNESEESFEE